MVGDNFYLAASGLLPVLALADVIVKRPTLRLDREDRVIRLNRLAPHVQLLGLLAWAALLFWSEFACLHALETERKPPGGAKPIWIMLGWLALQLLFDWSYPRLAAIFPERVLLDRPQDEAERASKTSRPSPPAT